MKVKDKEIKVIKSDRNEVRYHIHSETVTVLYKSRKGLAHGWEIAKRILLKGGVQYGSQ